MRSLHLASRLITIIGRLILQAESVISQGTPARAALYCKGGAGVKVEDRKSYREIDDEKHGGKMIAIARRLRRKTPKGACRSLRAIVDKQLSPGYKSESGKPYAATAIAGMPGELK